MVVFFIRPNYTKKRNVIFIEKEGIKNEKNYPDRRRDCRPC